MGGFWTRMGRAPKGIVSCKVLLDRTGFLLGKLGRLRKSD